MKRMNYFVTPVIAILLTIGCFAFSVAQAQDAGKNSDGERAFAAFPTLKMQQDWPWWRGPHRNGIVPGTASIPTKFGDEQNVIWKVPIPGRGHSSPVIVNGQIVLTTADTDKQIQSVLAFDSTSGKARWKVDLNQGGFPAKNHPNNTEATPTVASDGERLFVSFFHHESIETTALDLDGKQVWKEKVAPFNPKRYEYGYAPSPLLHKNLVIVSAEYDGTSGLTALDRATGKRVWQTKRRDNISFSSPVIAQVAGREQLLLSGGDKLTSYDPNSGAELWSTPGPATATCGTAVWEGDVIMASGGYPQSETIAVRGSDGSLLWKNNQKCYEQSMLAHQGHLYALTDAGILFCWRIADGKEMWKQRLKGPISSSPILAGGHIYWANERGTWYVFRPNPERFELIAENQLGTESFPSPAVSGGRLYIRSAATTDGKRQEYLVCIGS
ncbi:MAG: hypothetical protein RIS70_3995 [Planctomycetota bacterium]